MCVSFIGSEELERDVEFEVVGEAPDKAPPPQTNQEEVNSITNGNKDSAQPSTSSKGLFFLSLVYITLLLILCDPGSLLKTHSRNECAVSFYCIRVWVCSPLLFL